MSTRCRITTKSLFGLRYSVLNLEGVNSLDSSNQLSDFYSYIVINRDFIHITCLFSGCSVHLVSNPVFVFGVCILCVFDQVLELEQQHSTALQELSQTYNSEKEQLSEQQQLQLQVGELTSTARPADLF